MIDFAVSNLIMIQLIAQIVVGNHHFTCHRILYFIKQNFVKRLASHHNVNLLHFNDIIIEWGGGVSSQ